MVTIAGIILGGLALVGLITYFGKWTYLWKEWLTSVDHKRLGIMYIIVAIVMLLRGFADAIMAKRASCHLTTTIRSSPRTA